MAKKTIYFHIGTPKTGTTSIQSFLTDNLDQFEELGLFYPVINTNNMSPFAINAIEFSSILTKFKQDNSLGLFKFDKSRYCEIRKEIAPIWNKFRDLIDKSKADKILLSAEIFSLYDLVFWELVDHEDYDVKLVVYLRNPVEYLVSLYKERVKHFYKDRGEEPISLLEYVKNYEFSEIFDLIDKYAKYLGDENIIIRPYEKESLKNGDSVDDFFECLSCDISGNLKRQSSENISLSHDTTVISHFIKSFYEGVNYDRGYYPVYELTLADKGQQKTIDLIPKDVMKEVCDRYYARFCQISKKYLNRDEFFVKKYPKIYYKDENYESKGAFISYEQLDILKTALFEAFEDKKLSNKSFFYKLKKLFGLRRESSCQINKSFLEKISFVDFYK